MKKFFALYLFLITTTWAASAPNTPLFRWNRTAPIEVAGSGASIQILERFILAGPKSYGIGTMTLTKAVKDPESIATIVNDLKNESGFKFKRSFQYEGITFVEMDWKKGNRLMRYAISDVGDYRLISISSYRPGYAKISSPESAAIQLKWHQYEKLQGKRTSAILFDAVFPKANAQSSPIPGFDFSPILDSISGSEIGTSNLTGGVTTIDQNLNVNVTGAIDVSGDVNVSGLSEPIDRLGDITSDSLDRVDQISRDSLSEVDRIAGDSLSEVDRIAGDSLNEVDRISRDRLNEADQIIDDSLSEADRIAQETMDRVDANVEDALRQADETTQMVDKNWTETNKQFERANDIAAKLADPKHAFLLAGATAAGAVIGSTVATLAVQGVVKGLDWLIEKITDAKGKEERWQLFREAREKWEETMDNSRNLETSIDQFLLFNDVLKTIKDRLPEPEKSNLTIENVIAQFGREILLKKKRREQLYQEFMNTKSASCEAELSIKLQQMDGLINNMGMVMGHLQEHKKNNPGVNIFDDRYFCDQLGEMLRNLVDAESALQRYRMLMIAGQTEWRERALTDFEDLRDRTNDFNERQDGDYESREKSQITNRYDTNIGAMKRQYRQACQAQKTEPYNRCYDAKWNSPDAQAQRQRWEEAKTSELKALQDRSNYRSKNPLGLNTDVEAQRLERYRNWFQELEDQQFCAQNPNDERCLELNQFRFNGVFYNKERAFDRMNQVCPGREISLPQITARKAEEARRAAETKALESGRTVAGNNKSGGFFSAIGNFFKGIFDAIAGIFGFGGNKAVIGETHVQDVAIPSPEESHAIVDGQRHERALTATNTAKTNAEIASDYAQELQSEATTPLDIVSELAAQNVASGLDAGLGEKFSSDIQARLETLKTENASSEEIKKAITQIQDLKAMPQEERERILNALYTPDTLSPVFYQAFKKAFDSGSTPADLSLYLELSSSMMGIGFTWPANQIDLMAQLNQIPGVNASDMGMTIDMGLVPTKNYNPELFGILMEIKKADPADSQTLGPLLQRLRAHFTN